MPIFKVDGKHLAVSADLRPPPSLQCIMGRVYSHCYLESRARLCRVHLQSLDGLVICQVTAMLPKVQVLWCPVTRHTS